MFDMWKEEWITLLVVTISGVLCDLQYSYCHCLAMNFVCDLSMILYFYGFPTKKEGGAR